MKIRIKTKLGNAEIDLEGELEEFKKLYGNEKYQEIIGSFKKSNNIASESSLDTISSPENFALSENQVKDIGNASTLPDRIRVMKNAGYFNIPRPLGEITSHFQQYGYHYDTRTTDNALRKLCKKGVIRRIGKRGAYKYVRI